MTSTIRFENVSKRYTLRANRPRSFRDVFLGRGRDATAADDGAQKLWALRDVSFDVRAGETVGLMGSNGAGKSTALKLIGRIMPATSGQVTVRGRVAALLELGAGFHPDLSGRENVFLSGTLAGMDRAEIGGKYDAIVDFAELEAFMDVPVKHYSSGMFARLAFAVSVHLEPDLLLVDEVLAVGDHSFQRKCLDRIGEMRQQGVTICLVTHALDNVRRMCDRALWFDHGRLRADGPAEAIVREYLDESVGQESRRLMEDTGRLPGERRWGTRKLEIYRVRITDEHGQPQVIFKTGAPMVVHLDYRAPEPVPLPVFGLAFHRNDGLHLAGPNTGFSNVWLPVVEGEGTIAYKIPYLPLLEGLYHVTAASTNTDDTEIFDYHDRAYPFRVVNAESDVHEVYGLMTLRGEWETPLGQPPLAAGRSEQAA